jgi:hypothetical protein
MALKKPSVVSAANPNSFKTSGPSPTFIPVGDILDPLEVGKRLKIPAKTEDEMTRKVYELTRKRAARPLPSFKVGKLIRFRWTEIERWINDGIRAA